MDTQTIITVIIFVLSYALIASGKIDKTIVAMSGAGLMILTRIVSQDYAFREAIDYNTIALLMGMMVIVMVTKRTGLFEYLATSVVKVAKGKPTRLIIWLALVTGVISALLDNVTTIMLIMPIILRIAKEMRIKPFPFLLAAVFASNIGGTATLIGDPPNILIGSQAGLSYMDFIKNTSAISMLLLVVTTFAFAFMFRKELIIDEKVRQDIVNVNPNECIKDWPLLVKCLAVIGVTMLGFVIQGIIHYEAGTVAFIGAVILLLITKVSARDILHKIEWDTIFFFVGLFILVGGLKSTGVLTLLASQTIKLTHGNLMSTVIAILWVSAIASAFVDNIPFVAVMIGLIKDMGAIAGLSLAPVWWALSLGACLGGNGTMIGASANIIAVDMAKEMHYKITFWGYFKKAFPVMIFTILVSTAYLYFAYLR